MTAATRTLLAGLVRLAKGALAEFEKWLQAQGPDDDATRTR